MFISFDTWTGGRSITSWGTNAGAPDIPFQNWRRFKEAFAPELVARAIRESAIPVKRCLDPFGGSGTTALACQFLGVHPTTIEVNPFLADLIEAKLGHYDVSSLAKSFSHLVRHANKRRLDPANFYAAAPATFVEPGVDGRWIFDRGIAARLAAYVASLSKVRNLAHRRLLRVILGGVIIDLSNVIVSGKGRRYRRNWTDRPRRTGIDLDIAFCSALEAAVDNIVRFAPRAMESHTVLRGDARELIPSAGTIDIAIFSPPYPNSFDYTDVYNVELWALGYLRNWEDNARLRKSTLESHVQVKRAYARPPKGSRLLSNTLGSLVKKRELLWNGDIPEMIGGYFSDISKVVKRIHTRLRASGQIWAVVGDSRYAGMTIPVADIFSELAEYNNFSVIKREPFRSMRASAQQGGQYRLAETLLVLQKN